MNPTSTHPLFWLANRVFAAHSALTVLGLLWALLVGQALLSAFFAVLWLLAAVVWSEWKHAA